jgi:amino acid transporter
MQRLKISGLPSLVNALIMTSILSAGNGLLYSAARTLHGMSLEGHAPRIFSRCTKQGVPIWALAFSLSL